MFHGFKSIPHAQLYHMRRCHRGDRDPSRCASRVSIKLPGRLRTSFSIWMILRGRKLGRFSHFETKPTWVSVKKMWDMFDSISWFLGCNSCRDKPITKLYMYIFLYVRIPKKWHKQLLYRVWHMIYDVWFIVYYIWYMWYMTCDMWYMVYDIRCDTPWYIDIYTHTFLTHTHIYIYM